jgi:hypothetical protein
MVNTATGIIEHVTNGPEAVALEATGWKAFPTLAAAQAFASQNPLKRVGGAATGPAASAVSAARKVAAPFIDLGQFLGNLANANLWVRVGQVVLGLALLTVGLAKLIEGTSVGDKAAGVAKFAMLA